MPLVGQNDNVQYTVDLVQIHDMVFLLTNIFILVLEFFYCIVYAWVKWASLELDGYHKNMKK